MRTIPLVYSDSKKQYDSLTTMIFEHDESAFTAGGANAKFNTMIDGTANITTITGTPSFTSKGNYLNINPSVSASIPTINDSNGNPIKPDASTDTTFIGIEPMSGQVLNFQENVQITYQVFSNDPLFQLGSQSRPFGQFLPLANVIRNANRNQTEVTMLLGYIPPREANKWTTFKILMSLGFIAFVAGVGLIIWLCKMPANQAGEGTKTKGEVNQSEDTGADEKEVPLSQSQ